MPGTSTPLTPQQIREALAKWKVKTREIPGWETRNRGQRGAGWGPVYGFGVHHTGDDAPDSLDRQVIINGRTDLPGPLAQFGLNDDGTVDVIGCGRANHFGVGNSAVLAAVRDESYGAYPPRPTANDTDGNAHFYGVETYYSGKFRPAQYDAMVRLAAAICHAHGWTHKSVIGHKEWTAQKPDPGSVDMAAFRLDVDVLLTHGPDVPAPPIPLPPPTPKPVTPEEETMRLITAPGRPWAILSASGTMTIVPPGTPAATYTALGLPTTPGQVTVAVYDALRASSEAQKADAAGVKAAITQLGTQVGQLATALDKPKAV